MRGFASRDNPAILKHLEASVEKIPSSTFSCATPLDICVCVSMTCFYTPMCVYASVYARACVYVCIYMCMNAWKASQCQAQPFQGTIPGLESPKTRRQTLCVWHVNEKFRELKAGLADGPVRKTDDSVLAIIVCCAIRGSNRAA